MDADYFSVEAFLAENQVCRRCRVYNKPLNTRRRKYNAHLRSQFLRWGILEVAQNAM